MKRILTITILAAFIVFASSINLFPFVVANESCKAFPRGCESGGELAGLEGLKSGVTIGSLIAEGGTFFLKSISDFDLFLSLVESSELSGPDYNSLQAAINSAINNMEQARTTYLQLKNLADVTPYDQEIISSLIEFNYTAFQLERGLIPSIFEKVKTYLANGDVRGIYHEFYKNTGKILDLFYAVKKDVDKGNFPNLSTLWRVNQMISESKIFSQQVAQVFYKIKKYKE